MTCSCDIFTAPEVRAACEVCAKKCRICYRIHDPDPLAECVIDQEGRNLADLLDGEIDPEVRASIMGATTSADVVPAKGVRPWSKTARALVGAL